MWRTKNGNSLDCVSTSKRSERSRKKDFSEDIGHSTVLEMKKNGMERTLINQKENGTRRPIR